MIESLKMKKLYRITAKKIIPIVVLEEDGMDRNPDWKKIESWVKEEEKNCPCEYEMEIHPMNPHDNMPYPHHGWDDNCLVYHDGDEPYTLSEARLIAALNGLILRISKNNKISTDEAKKMTLDSLQSILVE